MTRSVYARGFGLLPVLCAIAAPLAAQTYSVLKRFGGTDGALPFAPLTQGLDGKLYSSTESGGTAGVGTIFKISPQGGFTSIYNFCAASGCPDGSTPTGALALGTDGLFYGVAHLGGSNGSGTIFKISSTGSIVKMHDFCAADLCPDGAQPLGGLTLALGGNLFGTTEDGGANGNAGTVFKITPGGRLTSLHSFCAVANCDDGNFLNSGVVQEPVTNGSFYGVTESAGVFGGGTVFKITPQGTLTTLYNFCALAGCTDGQEPFSGVILGMDGNLYGTTAYGGTNKNCPVGCGTVFQLTPNGILTTLHNFNSTDGYTPLGLVQATDGNFYGVTAYGGTFNKGTIFKISAGGVFTSLHSFVFSDGFQPRAAMIQGVDGKFYGTCLQGGSDFSQGSVFRLDVGLGANVKAVPFAGNKASTVHIIGTNLTGASSVTFNGVPAAFTIVSATHITATVPAGASTGPVRVTTAGGTLSSMPFYVLN